MKTETDLLAKYLNGIDIIVSYFPRHEKGIQSFFPNDYSLYDMEVIFSMKLGIGIYIAFSIFVQVSLLLLSMGGVNVGFPEWWMLPSLLILTTVLLILVVFESIPLAFEWWFSK
jgi:hypothetical protein